MCWLDVIRHFIVKHTECTMVQIWDTKAETQQYKLTHILQRLWAGHFKQTNSVLPVCVKQCNTR